MTALKVHTHIALALRVVLSLVMSLIIGCAFYGLNARWVAGDALPMPFGLGLATVLSGSMEPTLHVDDLVLVRKAESYDLNEVVVYQERSGSLVIHRIVALFESDGSVITQGDANNVPDEPIALTQIKGHMVARVPLVGAVVRFATSLPGAVLLVALCALLMHRTRVAEQRQADDELATLRRQVLELRATGLDDAGQDDAAAHDARDEVRP